MANVGALTIGRAIDVNSGVYLERRDRNEPAAEEWLRGLFAKLPQLRTHRRRIDRVVAMASQAESELQLMDVAALLARFKAALTHAAA